MLKENRISYTEEKMNNVRLRIQKLIDIVKELEADFPGRSFTLDGHLVGSIGEVMAAYYYGVELYTASTFAYDGEVRGKKIQIKISQQNKISISSEPEHLIVLYLNKGGNIYEVYNGPGKEPWEKAGKPDKRNNRYLTVNKLMEMDKGLGDDLRIPAVHEIEKMRPEYKNRK